MKAVIASLLMVGAGVASGVCVWNAQRSGCELPAPGGCCATEEPSQEPAVTGPVQAQPELVIATEHGCRGDCDHVVAAPLPAGAPAIGGCAEGGACCEEETEACEPGPASAPAAAAPVAAAAAECDGRVREAEGPAPQAPARACQGDVCTPQVPAAN